MCLIYIWDVPGSDIKTGRVSVTWSWREEALVIVMIHCTYTFMEMGLMESPACERCLEKDESATHILCDCEAIAYLRLRHVGHYFMEPGDYKDAPVSKILHFIRSVGLLEGRNRGGMHNRSR
jgi:hypothetical protein